MQIMHNMHRYALMRSGFPGLLDEDHLTRWAERAAYFVWTMNGQKAGIGSIRHGKY